MASVLNRTTLQFLPSVNTPEYPLAQWVHAPDLAPVAGVASKYWKLTGDVLSVMTAPEQAAVNAAELTAFRNAAIAQLDQLEDVLRAFMLIVLDDRNLVSAKMNTLLTAIDNAATLAALKTTVAAMTDLPTYTEAALKTAIKNRLGT